MFLVMRVPKPQEVRIVIDEQGLPKREEVVDSENAMLYDTVKEILRIYANENYQTIKQVLMYKLESQINNIEWSYDNFNSICWATACLADLKLNADERNLFVTFLRSLLAFCAQKKDMNDKIVIATNIMHVVSQNHIYLKDIPSFLSIVIKKLLEFAGEKSDEISQMACNIILKISKVLGSQIVKASQEKNQPEPVIETVLSLSNGIIENMSIIRKIDFYESIGYMISAEENEQMKIGYLIRASSQLEKMWLEINQNFNNPGYFTNIGNTNNVSLFLRINSNFCSSIGISYKLYFDRSFQKITELYELYYAIICQMISQNGVQCLNYSDMKKYRGVRKDILSLLQNFILAHKNNHNSFVNDYGSIIHKIIEIFVNENNETKEAEVFDLISAALSVLDQQSISVLLYSLPFILQSTLPMITQDFVSYTEIRYSFFGLLKSISDNCFQILINLESSNFQTIINCLLWALRHEIMNIHDIGIEAIISFLGNINTNMDYINQFYQTFFVQIFNEVLYVTTDKMHQNGFSNQSKCMYILFKVVPTFNFPLTGGTEENQVQLYNHMLKIMTSEFKNLSQKMHETRMQQLFVASQANEKEFKVALKDYLISLSLFTEDGRENKESVE